MVAKMDIDRPLSDFAKKNRSSFQRRSNRGGRDGSPQRTLTRPTSAPTTAASRRTSAANRASSAALAALPKQVGGGKIVISNLPDDVTKEQIQDLFSSTIGALKAPVQIVYNAKGKSTGVATLIFREFAHAQLAFDKYNGRLIDHTRPMKVEIVIDPQRVAPPPLTDRIAPLPQKAPKGSRKPTRQPKKSKPSDKTAKTTAKQLDVEMDAWKNHV